MLNIVVEDVSQYFMRQFMTFMLPCQKGMATYELDLSQRLLN